MFGKRLGWVVLLCFIVSIPVFPIQAESPNHYTPTYYLLDSCNVQIQPEGRRATCGYLTVPENRANAQSPTIQVAFAIIHTASTTPQSDPVVYLTGGPGSSMLWRTAENFEQYFNGFAYDRDIIIVDQRGTGESIPRLECNAEMDQSNLTVAERRQNQTQVVANRLLQCRERWQNSGVDLTVYNSANNAADLNDLRIALGYDEWNLFGVSYGSRLALTIMRDHPQGLRSIILDSVLPPQANMYTSLIDNNQNAFQRLFTACEQDWACNQQYPNLEEMFIRVISRYNTRPLRIALRNGELIIDGDRIYRWMYNWLYHSIDISRIPHTIYVLNNPRHAEFSDALLYGLESELNRPTVDVGMHYSVQCSEEVNFAQGTSFDDVMRRYPYLETYINNRLTIGSSILELCADWSPSPISMIENLPVISDIPTLILSGQYDPITPPEWGRLASSTLSASFFYEFPDVGHGVIRTDACAMQVAVLFLNTPTMEPNTSCMLERVTLAFIVES